MATEAPRTIGPYRLEEKLGAGGMGVVYKAVDTLLDRPVAIKMMHARDLLGDDVNQPEIYARFLREAKAAARIKSRHVAQVLQLGTTDDGEAYIVMEYLQGKTLSRVITRGGQMPAARVVHIARQLCRGMQSAHDLGVVHRDLKPANVMLVEEDGDTDFVKILDFGVAKLTNDTGAQGLTQTGALLGTLPFMAPEQISGQHIDARTDIYALGITLYRMFTGLSVWDADSLSDIVRHQLSSSPPSMFERVTNATFTPALDAAVLRCLAKDPAARWQSMREVAEALEAALEVGLGDTSTTAMRPMPWSSSSSSSLSSSLTAASNPGTLPTGNGNQSLAAIVTGQLDPRDVFSDGSTVNVFAEAATATRTAAAVTRSLPGVPMPSSSSSTSTSTSPSPSRRMMAASTSSGAGFKIAVAAAAAIVVVVVVVGAAVAFALSSAPAPALPTAPTRPPVSSPPTPPAPTPSTPSTPSTPPSTPADVLTSTPTPTPTPSVPPHVPVAATKPKVGKPKVAPVDDGGSDTDGFVRVRTRQEQ